MITIIINPISGGARPGVARRRAEQAAAALRAFGEDGEVFVTERKGHARELALGALARGVRLIVAWGGDGTVNEVGSAVVFGPTPLAIIPSGSGNGLATDLGISRDPARALADAFAASPRVIDAGELGGRRFFCTAGIGFDAHVASCFDRGGGKRGFATYVRISARELLAYDLRLYRLDTSAAHDPFSGSEASGSPARQPGWGGLPEEGAQASATASAPERAATRAAAGRSCRALLVTFANASQFGNGARIAPDARLDDGLLDLVVFEEVSRFRTICALPRFFAGRAAGLRGLSIQRVERAAIESDSPMEFHVDGEPAQGSARLDARVHAGALKVCVR